MKNAFLLLGLVALLSCNKADIVSLSEPHFPTCSDCAILTSAYQDTTDHPTVLGARSPNPYLIPNMEMAFRNVYKKDVRLKPSHVYMKFSPRDLRQLSELESLDLDLFDYPLDREVIVEGDHYQQDGKGEEEIPNFYAVVTAGTVINTSVSQEVLDQMYIPDNDPKLENEALRLTNTLNDDARLAYKTSATDGNAYPSCNSNPSGRLQVQQLLLDGMTLQPLDQVMVTVKRLFKIERMYTDENGIFRSKKYFRNNYTVVAKFKNKYAHISRTRHRHIFEQLFPLKINLGTWDDLDPMHSFIIPHVPRSGTVATSHWCAASTSHAVIAFHRLSRANGVAPPPSGLRIILSQKKGSGNGNTYMLHEMAKENELLLTGAEVLLLAAASAMDPMGALAVVAMTELMKVTAPDIHYGYGGDPSFLTTDRYNELVMHELSHASHFSVAGSSWWIRFGIAEATNEGEGTYGACCTEKAYMIALGEGWAYFAGHYFTDQLFGTRSTAFPEQGFINEGRETIEFSNQNNMSSHCYFLESFTPGRQADPSRWIPKGLFFDLIDPEEEQFICSGIADRVEGYSCQQIFSVMGSNIKDIHQYRLAFIARYGGERSASIEKLFSQYGY